MKTLEMREKIAGKLRGVPTKLLLSQLPIAIENIFGTKLLPRTCLFTQVSDMLMI